jgi:hypothetical protein
MNDFSELEAELKQLRPAPVSDEIFARIERALAEPETSAPTAGLLPRPARQNFWWSLGLGLAGAVALLFLGLGFFAERASSPDQAATETTLAAADRLTSGFRPSKLTQVVYHRHDDGLVFSPNQSEQLLRRVRYDTRQTMQWRNPRTGASLRVTYPAEQVVLTPVSFQ